MKVLQMEPWFGLEETKAINQYLSHNPWLAEFKETAKLEKILANYVGTKYCTMVANGTVSLIAALYALGVRKDDIVIVPDYTMIATASSASILGANVEFVDVEKDTLCMSYSSLIKKFGELGLRGLQEKVKCVILVSINGRYPTFLKEILEFCSKNSVPVLEDAAQSLGSFHRGKHVGTFGKIGSFSLSPPKIISTGIGGFLVTNNKQLNEDLKAIKNFGRRVSNVDKSDLMGWNFKFNDLLAVVGIEQMKKLPERIKIKRKNYKLYTECLENQKDIKFILTDLKSTTPWMNDILLLSEKNRKKLKMYLEKCGIETRIFYPSITQQKPFNFYKEKFKNSLSISSRGLWLPSSTKLSLEEINYICKKILRFQKNV